MCRDPRRARRRRAGRRPRRRGRRWPGRIRARTDGGGAPASPRARRLRHQRRAAARQEGRPAAAGARRAASPTRCGSAPGDRRVEVAGPGFLNIRSTRPRWPASPAPCVAAGPRVRAQRRPRRPADQPGVRLGQPDRPGPPRRGPVGGRRRRARPAAPRAAAPRSPREYYFNDAGAQIDRFAALAAAPRPAASRRRRTATPATYIADIAAADRRPSTRTRSTLPDDEATELFRREGVELMFDEIKSVAGTLRRRLRRVLQRAGPARPAASSTRALARLREQGHIFEADGAIWLRTTDFGDDKDRVLRQDATAT